MAGPPPNSSSDDISNLLLGLDTTKIGAHHNDRANNTEEVDAVTSADADDEEHWTALYAQVRTTAEGVEAFKRATSILSGEAGQIMFRSGAASDFSLLERDPLLVVKAYFRLLRCSVQDSPSIVHEKEWTQLTKTLLKNMGDSLKSSIQTQIKLLTERRDSSQCKGNSYNRSLRTQRNSTVLFYFRSMIDHIIPRVVSNTAILGSTYKIFSELAEIFVALLEMESTRISELVTSFLPAVGWTALSNLQEDVDHLDSTWRAFNECLKQGAFCIIEAMNEGLQTVQRAISGHQKWTSKPDGFSKIMVFMMARTTSLIILRRKRLQHCRYKPDVHVALRSSSNLRWTNESDDGDISLIRRCLLLLIKMRSLSVVVRGCIDDTSKRSSLNDGRLKLFEMMVALGLRVDVYAAKLICLARENQSPDDDSICAGIECLVGLSSEEFNVVLSVHGKEDKLVKSENVFSLGRLFVIKHILQRLHSTASDLCCGGIPSMTSARLCETAIFEDLPSCYHFFQSGSPSGLVLQTWVGTFLGDFVGALETFIRTLFVSENQDNPRNVMIRQHKLMVRWLADAQYTRLKCANLRQNHPFSNEIIMSILYTRVISSCSANGESDQDRCDLISLLVKLLFDKRTETSHRRPIAAFLARLLRSSNFTPDVKCGWETESTNAKLDSIRIMWRELKRSQLFNSNCAVAADTCSSGKRKRKSSHSFATAAFEIYWVLSILVEASISSQKVIDGTVMHDMRLLLENILSQSNHKHHHYGRFNDRQVSVISLLLGAMRCHPNIQALRRMLDGQDVIKSAHPFAFIDGSLALIDSFVCRQSKSRIPSLYYASVQFIAALSALRSEFSESHVKRIGTILKTIYSSISVISTFEKVRVQHLLVSAVCDMGHVVPPKISTESLMVRF